MRIWFPLATLLSVGWLLLVGVLVSRGGGSGAQASDAARLLRQSQEAMLELDSFQFQVTTPWYGREVTLRLAWQSPDSFHVLYPALSAESSSENPEPVITDEGFQEAIVIGDAIYFRECAPEGGDCQPWLKGLRDNVYVPLVPEFEPFWTIELLGMMSDAQVVGQEDIEGVACMRILGKANPTQAVIQSWRRAEEVRGPIYWGEECSETTSEPGGETQEECHETTLGDYIAMLEESAGEQDENLGSVEVWIGRDDKLMRRLEFPNLTDPEPAGYFALSQFNEADIQPPQ